ncbi:MAG TPA: ester cyclase [Anaerolineae bacterium]|nr:ester cyclase [Anaerolineae bacterium]
MDALDVVHQYFTAWNQHDAAGIVSTFADGGTYSDPTTSGALAGSAIAAYASGLWKPFPDLAFEITNVGPATDGVVAAEWVMRGTNSGSFNGLPPTGKRVEVPGADFIEIGDGKIRSVRGYFDSRLVPAHLGLQISVQPHRIGPFAFGSSVLVQSGKCTRPGAFSITSIEARNMEEVEWLRDQSRQISSEMLGMDGFIGFVGAVIGQRLLTITAWENETQPRALMHGGIHKNSMGRLFTDIGAGGMTSVWTPARFSPMRVRCLACGRMVDSDTAAGHCACGEALPPTPPYW